MTNALKQHTAAQKARKTTTPQTMRTPGRNDEVKNNAGGYVFEVSDKSRLERFLILGTDGGTYYVGQAQLTQSNIDFVKKMIKSNEQMVLDTVVEVSANGRAHKNTPAIFTLAMLLVEGENKAATRAAVNSVVRTGTHLFEFANFLNDLGGWGRAKRGAVADWYLGKTADELAYQVVKYRSREGFTHRDLFRLSHPVGVDSVVGDFILGKPVLPKYSATLDSFEDMQAAGSVKEVLSVLETNKNLPWETIPTQFLKEPKVWKTLFYNNAIGQTALLRNVTRFAKIGAFDDLQFTGDVATALADAERISKGRMHPVTYANALGMYTSGSKADNYHYFDNHIEWSVNNKIAAALEAGFNTSFASVTPANKKTMVSVDVSGSMTWGAPAGLVGLNYLEAAAVMAMVTVRSEPYAMINAFSTDMQEVNISDSDSFATVLNKFNRVRMGGTDVAKPMVFAKRKNLDIETFAIYTDNETWAGNIKPTQALAQYRKSSGNNARMAVVGLASTGFSVADASDSGQMDFVGFNANAPRVLADFSAGRL